MGVFDKELRELAKKFGPDSVMMISDMPERQPVSSGSLALDFATGIGGLPTDRVMEVAGLEGTGKTSLALLTMASFLDHDPERGALILDLEHKLSKGWVESLIGKERMSRVLLGWPLSVEKAHDLFVDAVSTDKFSFVMFDSIGGAPTQRSMDNSAEKASYGGNAKAISDFARTAGAYSQVHNTLVFGINQTREDMGGYNRLITPGGRAWKHACSLRVHLKKTKNVALEKIHGEDMPVGYEINAQVIKNQVGPQGRVASWWFYNVPTAKYGFGIDTLQEVVNLSMLTNVITQKGAWYYHDLFPNGQVQGRDAAVAAIRNADESIHIGLVKQIKDALATGLYNTAVAPYAPLPLEDVPEGDNYLTRMADE